MTSLLQRLGRPARPNFLERYRDAFGTIQGAFSFDAALFLFAYAQLNAENGVQGDSLEIGVHHGLSAIAIAAVRGPGRGFVAVDLFEEGQEANRSRSMAGSREIFLSNLRKFYTDIEFARVISTNSMALRAQDLGDHFSFVHIDGGHSVEETYHDISLAAAISLQGGLIAIDDYFNPSFPGVSEGAILFARDHPDLLRPVAIGFNKVLLQKNPVVIPVHELFQRRWKETTVSTVTLWGAAVPLSGTRFAPYVDISRSTPRKLRRQSIRLVADLVASCSELRAKPGEVATMDVLVRNRSSISFESGESPIALSYHVRAANGENARFENPRSYFRPPLMPNASRSLPLSIAAPESPGRYWIEVDLVWEGVTWFASKGNKTVRVPLVVD